MITVIEQIEASWPVVEVLIGIAVVLLLLDAFVATEVLSHIGIGALCVAVFQLVEAPLIWRVSIAVASWFVLVGMYYLLWKQLASALANHVIAPTRFKDSLQAIVGRTGCVEEVEGVRMCRVDDMLFPIDGEAPSPGCRVRVASEASGRLRLEELNE